MSFFFFNDTATTEIYTVSDTLSLHDALPICEHHHVHVPRPDGRRPGRRMRWPEGGGRRSEEHTSELQSPDTISYAVFCLKKKSTPPRTWCRTSAPAASPAPGRSRACRLRSATSPPAGLAAAPKSARRRRGGARTPAAG